MKKLRDLNDLAYESLLLMIDGRKSGWKGCFQDCVWMQDG